MCCPHPFRHGICDCCLAVTPQPGGISYGLLLLYAFPAADIGLGMVHMDAIEDAAAELLWGTNLAEDDVGVRGRALEHIGSLDDEQDLHTHNQATITISADTILMLAVL